MDGFSRCKNTHIVKVRQDEVLGYRSPMSEPGSGAIGPGEPGERVLDGVIAEEMGEEIIDSLRRVRHAEKSPYRPDHPAKGLRDPNRRLTRPPISPPPTAILP